jgi:hypothetical protein
MSIYKFMLLKHLDTFLDKGRVLFRPLSYFRDYEDEQVRGDPGEATRRFAPGKGLRITNHSGGFALTLPRSAFESQATAEQIYVFCASMACSDELANKFQAEACVEIVNVERFTYLLRTALSRKKKRLVCGEVSYYNEEDGPGATWALPDQIAMSKIESFRWQHEYRFTFASRATLAFENTRLQIVTGNGNKVRRKVGHYPMRFIQLGTLRSLCRVHDFGAFPPPEPMADLDATV